MYNRFTPCLALAGALLFACGDDGTGASAADSGDALDDLRREVGRDLPGEDDPDLTEEPDQGSTDDVNVDTAQSDTPIEPDLPSNETDCFDNVDNDGDGDFDCVDIDCATSCEICNDLLDNNLDGRTDCADPLCSNDPLCPERCTNEDDDDADGDVDCEDAECASTRRCTDEPMPLETYTFAPVGYISRLQYPPDGVPCCFNYDDDEGPDNRLLSVLGFIEGYEPQVEMDGVVNNGSVAILLEWRDFPESFETGGPVDFNVFRGAPVSPEPIGVEENAWVDGNGVFQVTEDSFDSIGPRVRFEDNLLGTDGVLTGGPHFLDLTVPIPELGLDLTLTVFQARLEVHLEDVSDGDELRVQTVSQTATGDDGEVTVGGGKLGGFVKADDLFAFFNEAAANCACATPSTASGPLFRYGERGEPDNEYIAACIWEPLSVGDIGFTCTTEDSAICPLLDQVCGLATLLPFTLDVDDNKNLIDEGISVGLFFDLVPATLDEDPVAD